jgi:diguanylate cyclase (GGDEF)-like protein
MTQLNLGQWFRADDIRKNRQEINCRNFSSLRKLAVIAIPITAVKTIGPLISGTFSLFYANLILLIYFIVTSVILFRMKKSRIPKIGTWLLYLYQTPVLLAALCSGSVLDPGHVAFHFLIYLACLCVIILDVPWHVYAYLTGWSAAFIIVAAAFKPAATAQADAFHMITTWLFTILAVTIILDDRLNEIRSYDKLAAADQRDELTGLYNRKYFTAEARRRVAQDYSEGNACIVYFDISGMKTFNEDYGFGAGDALLKHFAVILKQTCGRDKLYGRFGEDHFVILMDQKEWKEGTSRVAEQVNRYLLSHYNRKMADDHLLERNTMPLGLNAGICAVRDENFVPMACDRARIACHSVRGHGALRCRIYDAELDEETTNEQYILTHLDQALNEHWIKVYYQPVVRAMTDQLCSEEALARWDDPKLGLLSPARFVPTLEKRQLLYKVDLNVCEQVLKDFRIKEKHGLELLPVSVNLSRYDFVGRDMVKILSDLMDRYGYDHQLLIIEITESAYAADMEKMAEEVERFHKAGFKVWMDDFGSGYSSLNLLQDSHFDLIKLDMRFMHNFGARNELITESIISLAEKLSIDTLAEGVETASQRRFLRHAGCDRLQGYYYSKPRSLKEGLAEAESTKGKMREKPHLSAYLDQISRMNLMDPFGCFNDQIHDSRNYSLPCAISDFNEEDGTLTLLRFNSSFQLVQQKLMNAPQDLDTAGTAADRSRFKAGPETVEAIRSCIRSGLWASTRLDFSGTGVTLYCHPVASAPQRKRTAVMFVLIIAD